MILIGKFVVLFEGCEEKTIVRFGSWLEESINKPNECRNELLLTFVFTVFSQLPHL